MASICTPVAVVTSLRDGHVHGTTVSAFASLSLDPPMVLVALGRDSQLLREIRTTGRFGVNVLSSGQQSLAASFARKVSDKFAGVAWSQVAGVPMLDGVAGFLACSTDRLVDGGDHVVLHAMVRVARALPLAPLTYHLREFGTHTAIGLLA
jgi:flavin reductase (DIM6/NTAB) family NADH-FMN oxidoreductase RutF